MKKAILQVADTGPLESLVEMLHYAGYESYYCSESLQSTLRGVGCDTVVSIEGLVKAWGYENPTITVKQADPKDMGDCDLYVDVKAHRNLPKVIAKWPNLKGKVLWYRINGGQPEHVKRTREGRYEDMGNEMEPGCPIVTPNMWYSNRNARVCSNCNWVHPPGLMLFTGACPGCGCKERKMQPWYGNAYAMWPPFHGIERYQQPRETTYTSPICLVHNINGWGFGPLVTPTRSQFGLKIHGRGSPDGLLGHGVVPHLLRSSIAMIHLKSSDAPGYALYEALASGCPLIVSRKLIWKNRMQDLLIPDETCLVFDRETHEGLTPQDVESCMTEIGQNLDALKNPIYNRHIGEAGKKRLNDLMWTKEKDGESFKTFMNHHFGA